MSFSYKEQEFLLVIVGYKKTLMNNYFSASITTDPTSVVTVEDGSIRMSILKNNGFSYFQDFGTVQ